MSEQIHGYQIDLPFEDDVQSQLERTQASELISHLLKTEAEIVELNSPEESIGTQLDAPVSVSPELPLEPKIVLLKDPPIYLNSPREYLESSFLKRSLMLLSESHSLDGMRSAALLVLASDNPNSPLARNLKKSLGNHIGKDFDEEVMDEAAQRKLAESFQNFCSFLKCTTIEIPKGMDKDKVDDYCFDLFLEIEHQYYGSHIADLQRDRLRRKLTTEMKEGELARKKIIGQKTRDGGQYKD